MKRLKLGAHQTRSYGHSFLWFLFSVKKNNNNDQIDGEGTIGSGIV